ncbi:hemerythrin domain-containing protein [Aquibacillus saliphilus]|uniref:hemerythrin domain-containing protein n=1 Tax=Aquibacillus saliphilus TaxID=1909422 RepID=UPI001CEFDEC7|nr:hemerythrin domain-containing protein [Aquibacillus saliphilus]
MVKRKKGIERHESLISLSHHHHHALFLALNLRKVGTEKSKYSPEEVKAELRQFWEPGGQQHFREEEEILLPVYAQHQSIEQPEITEMLLEHVKIRSMIMQILETENEIIPLMNDLGVQLDAHIRKEERVIFPMIEKALPEHILKSLEQYLHKD